MDKDKGYDELVSILREAKPGFRFSRSAASPARSAVAATESPDLDALQRRVSAAVERAQAQPSGEQRAAADAALAGEDSARTAVDAGAILRATMGGSRSAGSAAGVRAADAGTPANPDSAASVAAALPAPEDIELLSVEPDREGFDDSGLVHRKTVVVSRSKKAIIGEQG